MNRNQLRICLIAILTIGLILLSLSAASNRSASAGQGKGGEVIAKPTPIPKKTPPARPKTSSRTPRSNTGADELAFWETIKNSTDPEDFRAYLEQYPKGKFVTLAKNRLKILEAGKAKPAATPNEQAESRSPATNDPKPEKPDIVAPPGETKEDAPKHISKAQELATYDREATTTEYRIAVKLDPGKAEYHYLLSLSLATQCKYPEAAAEARESIRIEPTDSRYAWLSGLLESERKYEESEAALREAVRLKPNYWPWHSSLGSKLAVHGRWAEAEPELREMIRVHDNKAWGHSDFGNALVSVKRYPEAELEFREAIRLALAGDVLLPVYHFHLGGVLAAEKRWTEAEAEMRECIRSYFGGSSTQDGFWKSLAKLFEDQGRLAEADGIYREGLRSFPKELNIRIRYAEWLGKQKRWVDAETNCREAIRLSSSPSAEFYASLGNALKGQDRLAEAEAEYRKALHLDVFNLNARRGLPDCLERQNRLKEAETEYRTLVQVGCAYADAHGDYGDFLGRQKRWKEAEAQYNEAMLKDPKNTEYQQKRQAAINAQKK